MPVKMDTIRKQKEKIRMTNEIAKVFSSEKFGNVRVVVLSDEPWFVGKDIAETLGYKNPNEAIMDHVDNEDKFMRSTRVAKC